MSQPRLAPVLRALQTDIDRIQSVSVTDTPNLLNKLDELVVLVEELPLLNAVGANSRATPRPASPWAMCGSRRGVKDSGRSWEPACGQS